jgi:pyridoxamine 5'-phosphate oxidase
MQKPELSKLRKNYNSGELNESNLTIDPFKQFEIWFNEVLSNDKLEANAMVLSTVSKNLSPSSRFVLLKDYSEKGFVFFTNYNSKKGKEIEGNKNVALLFFWPSLERQVRIEGTIKKTSAKISDEYFYSRPVESQASAIISEQSTVINDYNNLVIQQQETLINNILKRPENWGGYIVTPILFEFWQGRINRLHDRIQYRFEKNKSWKIERLSP